MKTKTLLLTLLAFFGLAFNVNAVSSIEELEAFEAGIPSTQLREDRRAYLSSEEAEAAKDFALTQLADVESQKTAMRYLLLWTITNIQSEAAETVTAAVIAQGIDSWRTSWFKAKAVTQDWVDEPTAEGWIDSGAIRKVHYPMLRPKPALQGRAYMLLLGTGDYSAGYQVWLSGHLVKLSDADAVDLAAEEIRVLMGVPESDARNEWLAKLRTIHAVRKGLL